MISFKYTARDPASGQKVSSTVQADNEAAAAKLIQKEGLAPIDIKAETGGKFNPLAKVKGRIKTKERIIFSRQLSTLINAGLPLTQSLRNVNEQTENKSFKLIISQVIGDIEGGSSFADALAKHPKVFNNIYVNLVEAGEVSGTLDKALERIAFQQEKDAEIVAKIRGAMAYPAIVVLVMVGVVGFMVVKVLPQVENIYKELPGAKLPLITTVLLSFSHFVTNFWYIFVGLLIFSAFAVSRYARTPGGKQVVDSFKMKTPPIGGLFMKVYMARFARTGTTLVASGVPLIKMLEIVSQSINNVHLERSIKNAIEKVKGGKSLSESIEGDPNFLPLVPSMLKVGEQSGELETMMERTADYYEKEVDNQIKAISTIIEPVLMVLLGIVAFTIVAAVLLPIYGLAGQSIIK